MWLAMKNSPAITLRLGIDVVSILQSALTMITEEEQKAATKEADQAAGASAAQLASRQAQQQVAFQTSEHSGSAGSHISQQPSACV